jgi:hypothetical protein
MRFDINTNIYRNGERQDVKQYNFMNFSVCVDVNTIKTFLDKNSVKYKEE